MKNKTIILGGGCFWCTEAVFQMIKGVESVAPGYAGGEIDNPTYQQVSSGQTGHIEVVKIEYNPEILELKDLFEIFFAMHDPTSMDKQGHDAGPQYHSIIFWTEDDQRQQAENFIEAKQLKDEIKIVTEVRRLIKFYPAEDYHQNYYKNNTTKPYCILNIAPKIRKVEAQFGDSLE
ncbi:peptide-methionine (S)-S-oxide reductase [Candidatus Falkowbacteria bacterium RIFOXYA2_FULL_35_8]|uniref:Peptide methionine sulfoxide reductase MsrA n=1 Tax=Candidatus Falkowbacteria bacterium RIFOXYC2_FULL_36_12 TaxID=1798002 RepID=A0A1F5SYW5_9BACT|nr:MAG: peptide-methionine (S)-S-oxide reductase [Candidatus Falkowbacteria bacterium RIFOXYB2_FULL_35_7]OGF31849.1 MAG: peptide-methionine (S)-S-oxide reductase [Candidatus Falkowbacteria bacterium RIFOXYC2_FULL_36_12]OGF34629.1 MAG: peptide-methionine (S)-S-oxide reductase [Candidatus Falkowbacteria bacterium RIFOXYA2_FULL_35_8]